MTFALEAVMPYLLTFIKGGVFVPEALRFHMSLNRWASCNAPYSIS